MSKDERKELLAQIERQTSRGESPQRTLQRAEQELAEGHLDQARRLLRQLESTHPRMAGVDDLRRRLGEEQQAEEHKTKLFQAEEMLRRFIQQRKKPLAEMALETLLEIAPAHPRRQDYERWVAELDQEVELQERVDAELEAGRGALQRGDIAQARKHLAELGKLDPLALAVETLTQEVAAEEEGQAASADIERLKRKVEELIAGEDFDEAEREVERLSALDVPKLTIDFLRKRLEEGRRQARTQAEVENFTARLHRYLERHEWQQARDVVHEFGQRFRDRPEASEFFNLVTEREAAERRKQSLEQGISTLEKFLAEGKRREAEVAVKLLRQLELDEERLAHYAARVDAM